MYTHPKYPNNDVLWFTRYSMCPTSYPGTLQVWTTSWQGELSAGPASELVTNVLYYTPVWYTGHPGHVTARDALHFWPINTMGCDCHLKHQNLVLSRIHINLYTSWLYGYTPWRFPASAMTVETGVINTRTATRSDEILSVVLSNVVWSYSKSLIISERLKWKIKLSTLWQLMA